MRKKQEIFYAKILLFGEYSVIYNSMGLIIPYSHFQAELAFMNKDHYTNLDFAKKSNNQLKNYAESLLLKQKQGNLKVKLNLHDFIDDVKKGLYFESSIPQGYGLGSSAALVAAIYSRYTKNKIKSRRNITSDEILQLKSYFSELEGFFHGTSSGVDPLNSYIKYPVLMKGKKQFETVGIPRTDNGKDNAIFLLNTGKSRKTEPLVQLFLKKNKEKNYQKAIKEELIPLNNQCIHFLLEGNLSEFRIALKKISAFQLNYFKEMIPQSCLEYWEKGLNTDDYYLKLCGAGGGGFILGFTGEYDSVKENFSKNNKEFIPVYRSNGK